MDVSISPLQLDSSGFGPVTGIGSPFWDMTTSPLLEQMGWCEYAKASRLQYQEDDI